jgi:hypothetical protein
LAKTAMAISALKHHTEQVISTSNYIKARYFTHQDVSSGEIPLTYNIFNIHGSMKEVSRRKKILSYRKGNSSK